jgi:hypothetical protein
MPFAAACASLIVRFQVVPVAVITIEDMPQSDDLDREAMRSIVGGTSTGARPIHIDQAASGSGRIVEYPPGFSRHRPIPGGPTTRRDEPRSRCERYVRRQRHRNSGSFNEGLFSCLAG